MKKTLHLDKKMIARLEKVSQELDIAEENVWNELNIIEDNINDIADDKMKECLCNYFIIRLIGLIENFCKKEVEHLIDEKELPYDDLILSISLSDLKKITKNGKISPGKLVTAVLNLQDPTVINSTFSKLLQVNDYFEELKKHLSLMEDWQKNFRELLQLRHKIVHENYSAGVFDRGGLFRKRLIYMNFTVASSGIFIVQLKKLGKKWEGFKHKKKN